MKRLTLTTKLFLLLSVPAVGMLCFGLNGAWEKWSVARSYVRLRSSTDVLGQMGILVHELQRERGRAAVFVGSKGAKFAEELTSQQQATDGELKKLQELLPRFDANVFGSQFATNFKSALDSLAELTGKRAAVRAFSLTPGESTEYFTRTIAQLLDVTVAMSHQVKDAEIAHGIGCYVSFIQTKEQMGIERAVLAGVFSADKFTGDAFFRFSKATAAQETYLRVFESMASPAQKKIRLETVNGPIVDATLKMRQTAMDKAAAGGFGVDSAVWFDSITSVMELMKKVEDHLAQDYRDSAARIEKSAKRGLTFYCAAMAALLAVTVAFGFGTIRSIAGPLKQIIAELSAGAVQTASAAGQVSSASQTLAEGASEQSASLEETSASLEEMSSMTKRNSDNAQNAKALANQTRVAADTGATDMREMSSAMREMKQASDNISRIIKTIDEIAFQTNILALNAAVEAARSGDAGMGFAVVADEVRSLALRSAQAARETAGMIEDSVRKSDRGVQLSGKVESSFGDIVGKARQVDELVAEIAAATKEQSQGITEVNSAVSQMDRITQSNAASAEESASAAEELNAQAASLKNAVDELQKLIDGGKKSRREQKDVRAEQPTRPAAPAIHQNGTIRLNGNGNGNTAAQLVASRSRNPVSLPLDDDGFRDH